MRIEIIDVSAPVSIKKYYTIEVAYRADGKTQGKKLMSFLFPETYIILSKAKRGDVFEVTSVKNDAGYWDWTEVTKSENHTGASIELAPVAGRDFKKEATTVKSNYETAEERAARQVMIVRQSSISNAIATLSVGAKTLKSEDVIATAKEYEAYVLGGTPRQLAEAAVAAIESDILE